jgi:hypothetical protein
MRWIVIVACALAILGCGGPGVVGKWNYEVFGQTVVLDLKEDNTFSMGSASTSAQAGTYSVEDGKVFLNFGSAETPNMTLAISEDGNTLSGTVGAVTMNLTRQQ